MADRSNEYSDDGLSGADRARASDAPILIGPELAPPSPGTLRFAGLGTAACLAMALALAAGWLDAAPKPGSTADSAQRPTVVRRSPADAPGFMQAVDPVLANGSPHVFAMLVMPEQEKARLKRALEDSPMRIGAVTVWDNVDEDGDYIRISAAGFAQEVLILHKPKTFFVPYLPGGSVRIEGTRDGGGGGITLAVTTALGPLPLPPLAVGQVVEIELP